MYRTIGKFIFWKFDFLEFLMKNAFFAWKKILHKIFFLNKYISMYTCSRPKISRRFRIWSQIRSNLNILGDIAIFWFLLDIKKNAPEKWFVGHFSEVYHPIRGSYTSFCDNVISNNLIPSFLQSASLNSLSTKSLLTKSHDFSSWLLSNNYLSFFRTYQSFKSDF